MRTRTPLIEFWCTQSPRVNGTNIMYMHKFSMLLLLVQNTSYLTDKKPRLNEGKGANKNKERSNQASSRRTTQLDFRSIPFQRLAAAASLGAGFGGRESNHASVGNGETTERTDADADGSWS